MSDFKDRLLVEKEELNGKIERLRGFIAGGKFETIDPGQQTLLPIQLDVMTAYSQILAARIALLG